MHNMSICNSKEIDEIRLEDLKELLGAIGIGITHETEDWTYGIREYACLHDLRTDSRIGIASSVGFSCLWISYNDLWKDIIQNKEFVKYYSWDGICRLVKSISNPYLGCKSLEEARIRRDLLNG